MSEAETEVVTDTTPEDDDVATGIMKRWRDRELDAVVRGGIQRGRLSPIRPGTMEPEVRQIPYAGFGVQQGPQPNQPDTGGDTIDFRLVQIDVRGIKADVASAMKSIRAAFVRRTFEVPNVVGMMGCMDMPEQGGMKQDPQRRAGEDVWIGTVALCVVCHRRFLDEVENVPDRV